MELVSGSGDQRVYAQITQSAAAAASDSSPKPSMQNSPRVQWPVYATRLRRSVHAIASQLSQPTAARQLRGMPVGEQLRGTGWGPRPLQLPGTRPAPALSWRTFEARLWRRVSQAAGDEQWLVSNDNDSPRAGACAEARGTGASAMQNMSLADRVLEQIKQRAAPLADESTRTIIGEVQAASETTASPVAQPRASDVSARASSGAPESGAEGERDKGRMVWALKSDRRHGDHWTRALERSLPPPESSAPTTAQALVRMWRSGVNA